jgi:hypothetical protein
MAQSRLTEMFIFLSAFGGKRTCRKSAIIAVDVRRFGHAINMDEVFGTHTRIGGDLCDGSFSETTSLQSAGRFCAFFSSPEIPFPGNGDRERQRLGSNAGYAEGSPSIWCCRDHAAGMSARRATPMP